MKIAVLGALNALDALGAPGSGQAELADKLAAALRARNHTVLLTVHCEFADEESVSGANSGSAEFHLAAGVSAPTQPGQFDLILLVGLDASGFQHASIDSQDALQLADTELRLALVQSAVEFQVIYGTGKQRLGHALRAIDRLQAKTARTLSGNREPEKSQTAQTAQPAKPWVWPCEKCSDSECEHQLFRRLLG